MGIIRKALKPIFRVAWKLAIMMRMKPFIIMAVSSNRLVAWIYSLTIGILQSEEPMAINGSKMRVFQEGHKGGWIGASMVIGGNYEPYTTHLFKQILKEGMVVVDVGAHIGYYTLLAANLVGGKGNVIAFEPEPQNFDLLLDNIGLNGYRNIEPHRKAIFSRSGKMQLYMGIQSGTHSLVRFKDTTEETIMIDMVSLDEFLGQIKVDLVKVDTQGAELDVLLGMKGIIKRNKDLKLIIEFQEYEGFLLRQLWNELIDSGFDYIYLIDEGGKIKEAGYQYAVDFCKKKRIDGVNLLCTKRPFKEVVNR